MSEGMAARFRRYSLELIVVFFGVWLGLLAENFRENRQERRAERVSLARLNRDLAIDRQDMAGNLERAREGHSAASWLLRHADSTDVDPDSVGYYLTRFQYISGLALNTSEYTALKSSGRINIVRDADLRQRLTRLYESYPFVEALHESDRTEVWVAMDHIAPHVRLGFPETSAFPPTKVVGDPSALLRDPGFLQSVARVISVRRLLIAGYEAKLPEIDALRALTGAQAGTSATDSIP
ncbi:MAG: hypothetical protein OEZ37_01770 [Gemmatimonadota bacterium]|nr:hypothetical protein [Gemmatimonadota bacterium]